MPTYRVTDPKTGKKLKITGANPPTKDQLDRIFASSGGESASADTEKAQDIEYKPGKESGGMLSEIVNGIMGVPKAAYGEMTSGRASDPISALGKVLAEGAINSGAERAAPFLTEADNDPDNAGLRKIQALLSTIPLPGFGGTAARGERAIQTDPNKPYIEDPNALEGLGTEALMAGAPKLMPPITGAIKGAGAAVGAPMRSNALSRLASIQSVPSNPLPRVPTPWKNNPISMARSGVEEVSNMLRSPTAARGQIKLADMLDPRGKVNPDAASLLGPMEDVVQPIQGPNNPLPLDSFEPTPRTGLNPNRNPPSAGPINMPPEEALNLNLDDSLSMPSKPNPLEPLTIDDPIQSGPLGGMAESVEEAARKAALESRFPDLGIKDSMNRRAASIGADENKFFLKTKEGLAPTPMSREQMMQMDPKQSVAHMKSDGTIDIYRGGMIDEGLTRVLRQGMQQRQLSLR